MSKGKKRHSEWKSCRSKTRYRTEGEALHAIRRITRSRDVDLDVYFCGQCCGWHLTKRLEFWGDKWN